MQKNSTSLRSPKIGILPVGYSFSAWLRILAKARTFNKEVSFFTGFSMLLRSIPVSIFALIQSLVYGRRIARAVVTEPVFILGFWRSGTTLLHELLCCDQRHGYPSTYSSHSPLAFLLFESTLRQKPIATYRFKRPMDQMEISFLSPQEDEWALLAMGAPSPYGMFHFPSIAKDAHQLLDFDGYSAIDQAQWRYSLKRYLAKLTVQQNRRLILKSPTHGFRVRPILQEFSDARFIIIERDPIEIFSSNVHMLKSMLEMHSFENFEESAIEDFVLDAYKFHDEKINDAKRLIPPERLCVVNYEDLAIKPFETVQLIYKRLGLGDISQSGERIKAYLNNKKNHQRNPITISLAQRSRIESKWREILLRYRSGRTT